MDFLQQKESNNGVHLTVYASGDGSLSLVFQENLTRNASSLRVTSRDVDAFLERRPDLKKFRKFYNGGFKLYMPACRVSDDEIQMGGKSYRYVKVQEHLFHIFDEEGVEIKNENIIGSIRFFVNNEKEIEGRNG